MKLKYIGLLFVSLFVLSSVSLLENAEATEVHEVTLKLHKGDKIYVLEHDSHLYINDRVVFNNKDYCSLTYYNVHEEILNKLVKLGYVGELTRDVYENEEVIKRRDYGFVTDKNGHESFPIDWRSGFFSQNKHTTWVTIIAN